MKKAISYLLALVMVISLLPGAAMTVSAQEDTTPKQNNYYSNVIVDESFDNINSGITKGLNGTSADEQYTVQASGAAQLKTGTMTANGVCDAVARQGLGDTAFVADRGFEISFEATFNDLVVVKPASAHNTAGGFIVDVRAASRCRYAFYADAEGNIWVTQYDTTAAAFDTGANLGDKNVPVRIVVDDDMNTTVTVDGHYVGRFSTSKRETTDNKDFLIYSGTMNRAGDNRVNDVILYDLKLSQDPGATELQAYYTYDEPYLDGAFNEFNWAFDVSDKVAALSDENYLYLAVNNKDADPDFMINGVALTADPAAGIVTDANGVWAGKVVKSGNKSEIKIPLKSVLGLDYAPGQKVGFAYTEAGFDGAVVLASRALISYEGFNGTLTSGSTSSEVYAKETNGTLQLKTETYSAGGNQELFRKAISPERMNMTAPVEIEFTADFTDLVVPVVPGTKQEWSWSSMSYVTTVTNPTSPLNWYAAGVSIELRADPCHHYGFHADAEGNIYVTQRMETYGEVTRVDLGVDVGATNVNVRLATDANDVTTIYVNGVALAETLKASTFTCPLTGGRGNYQIINSTLHRDTTSDRQNDVTLYDLVLTQDVPQPVLKVHPMADSSSADITAYLNPNGVELDGVLAEAEWYTPYAVAGTGDVPSGLVGIGWGNGNLYIGGDTKAEIVKITIGGKSAIANLRPYQTPKHGKFAATNASFEWVVPLSSFNLPDGVLDQKVSYELNLGDNRESSHSTLTGTLHFSGQQMLLGDTGRTYSGTDYAMTTGNGHIHWDRTDDGYAITAEGLNELKDNGSIYAVGIFVQKNSIPIDYTGGAFDLTMTATVNDLPNLLETAEFGMRGLVFELCGDSMRAVFALRKDASGKIWMDICDTQGIQHCDTGVQVGTGEETTFRFAMDDKQSISLYVNDEDEPVYSFVPIDRGDLDATLVQLPVPHFMWGSYNGDRALDNSGKVSVVDVVVHDLRLTKNPYADSDAVVQAALEQITEESILNGGDPTDVTAMTLPASLTVDHIGETVNLSWSAIDKLTNRTAYGVDVKTGTVTRSESTKAFDLMVSVSYEGATGSKTFIFETKGSAVTTGNVALIENDDAPANGVATDWNSDRYVYLDNTHNSIVVDRGSSLPFNRITLRDTDNYSRVSQRHLGVFISDDGQTWEKVTGWMLHHSGRNYTLYNLNETARYVKVHCYHDDLDLVEGPTFYNKLSDMIKVSNETNLPGAYGKFAYSKTFNATNSTGEAQKDTPVYVSLESLGATADQYKAGCADFRFTVGDTTLAHWYNGEDGFYVRVPSIPANGSTTVTAHWGCGRVEDYSDGEAVFEVTYGNVSLINLSRETYEGSGGNLEQSILSHGRPFTFPNGDVIVVGRTMKAASNAGVFRSTDGGHTFKFDNMAFLDGDYISAEPFNGATYRSSGFGGYMWDDSIKTEKNGVKYEGRLYLITYSGQGGNASDYRLVLQYSDDYAHTWSEPVFLSLPGANDIIKASTKNSENPESVVSTLQNAQARIGAPDKADDGDPNTIKAGEMATRAQIVCDGLVLRDADGDGPNVDYVIHHGEMIYDYTLDANGNRVATNPDKNKRNVATAIYSSDGGLTWYCSDTLICIPGVLPIRHMEDGLSEGSIAQLDNGDLYVVIRAQEEGNYYQYKAVSKDFGKTWIETDYDNVLSSNTSPVLVQYGKHRLEMWSACTGLGEVSYRRTPMHLGLSTDNYETFEKILDLTFSTAFDSVRALQGRKSQPGIAISADGKSAFVCYHDQYWHKNEGAWAVDAGKFLEKGGTMGFAIEEFDQMVYGTKGAWDDFEDSSLKYQGWLVDTHGTIELSRQQSVSGKYSMKVVDATSSSPAHALRQIPSMKSGTVGAKLMVPSTNDTPFVMELKSAYNYEHMKFTIAAIYVTPGGSVGYVDANKEQHALFTVEAGSWNDYAVSFDVSAGTATLYVNGTSAGNFALPSETPVYDLSGDVVEYADVHGVTVVQFNQAATTSPKGDCLYVDDFYANELVDMNRSLEAPAEQTLLGRFVSIVIKVIEVGGELVEISQWGWIPGL